MKKKPHNDGKNPVTFDNIYLNNCLEAKKAIILDPFQQLNHHFALRSFSVDKQQTKEGIFLSQLP